MPKTLLPTFVPPMMAQSAKEPFDWPDWIFEIKLDSHQAITVFDASLHRQIALRKSAEHQRENSVGSAEACVRNRVSELTAAEFIAPDL